MLEQSIKNALKAARKCLSSELKNNNMNRVIKIQGEIKNLEFQLQIVK